MKNVDIKAGLCAGFMASVISSLVLLVLTSLSLIPEFDFVVIQGALFGFAGTVLSAWIVYFIIGTLIWGSLYASMESRIAGNNPFSKGLLFGLFIWLIIMIVMMPLAGVGIFVKQYGLVAAGIMLLTDLVFGVSTAFFYAKCREKMKRR